jgi:thiamine biosynthesis protein ThiS
MTPEAPRSATKRVLDPGEGATVALNGQKRRLEPGTTVSGLLKELELPEDRVAVELDGEILRRPLWGLTEPGEGARLEIVHFVGGG